jgi:hypothetical protein
MFRLPIFSAARPVEQRDDRQAEGNPVDEDERVNHRVFLLRTAAHVQLAETTHQRPRAVLRIKEGGGSDQSAAPPQIVVVQHWTEELKRLVPIN